MAYQINKKIMSKATGDDQLVKGSIKVTNDAKHHVSLPSSVPAISCRIYVHGMNGDRLTHVCMLFVVRVAGRSRCMYTLATGYWGFSGPQNLESFEV